MLRSDEVPGKPGVAGKSLCTEVPAACAWTGLGTGSLRSNRKETMTQVM